MGTCAREGVIVADGTDPRSSRLRVAVPPGQVDMVNHPAHYRQENPLYEPAKVIRAWGLPWALGDAVKYIARAGRKGNKAEDLRKAVWYLTDEIDALDPPPPPFDPVTDHDSLDGHRMMHAALRNAHMRTEPDMEMKLAMKDEVRVLREIAEQGWVVIRAEHV